MSDLVKLRNKHNGKKKLFFSCSCLENANNNQKSPQILPGNTHGNGSLLSLFSPRSLRCFEKPLFTLLINRNTYIFIRQGITFSTFHL